MLLAVQPLVPAKGGTLEKRLVRLYAREGDGGGARPMEANTEPGHVRGGGCGATTMSRGPEAEAAAELLRAMTALAGGDFGVRIDPTGLGESAVDLAEGFNAMADALSAEAATRGQAEAQAGAVDRIPGEEAVRMFQFSVEKAPDAVFWLDRDAGFYYVNDQACRSLGYTREELMSLRLWDIDLVYPQSAWAKQWDGRGTAEEMVFRHHITRHRRKDGAIFPVEIASRHVSLGNREFHVAYARDVSERIRAEEILRRHTHLLQESQQIARLGHYELDVEAGTWVSSEVLDEVFGISAGYPKTLAGWLDLVHPDSRDELDVYLREHVIEGRRSFDREYRIIRPSDGAEVWVHGLGDLEYDEQGRVVRMLGTIQDIDSRKRLEEQLLQSQRMEAVGQLAGGVAHDFNNMLSVILGNVELIRLRLPAGDPMHEELAEIERAAVHSRDTTRQLLAFSRRQVIALETLDLNRHIDRTVRTLSHLIGDDIGLQFRPGADLGSIRFDPTQVDQILVNLALNARDAMPEGGTLSIETSRKSVDAAFRRTVPGSASGEYILLSVSDTGRGMDQSTLAKIFEPYFSTKTLDQASGLGLATVYGIVKQNGGFIDVRSRPNQGSRFLVYLPRGAAAVSSASVDAADRAPPVSPRAEGAPKGSARAGIGHILLVEDDELVRRMTGAMLRKLGYRITVAETPARALEICRQPDLHIDLLLTDVIMPELNGPELHDRIAEIHPGLGVLFMSGYTADVIVDDGVLGEHVHFLQKPFSVGALAEKVRSAMVSSPPQA